MRTRLYQLLVNRQPGIAQRYHRIHDGRRGMGRFVSYVYLLWLNLAYYFMFCRWLGKPLQIAIYEEKRLPVNESESALDRRESPESLAEKLSRFDVISFDIFDTLVFRPFSEPTDLFFIVGQKLGYMDFKRIRMEAEHQARRNKFKRCTSFEVTIQEIWAQLERMTGIDAVYGMKLEVETELALCYANPYMEKVFHLLQEAGKRIVITSDMYLTPDILEQLLDKCGYTGYEKIFVSCEEQKAKGDGKLFDRVRQVCSAESKGRLNFAHVGDNPGSDVRMANKHGFKAFAYPNVNRNTLLYRTYDLSPIIGGAYRGIVNNRIYCGTTVYNRNQEYGYIYGGLFVLGYCCFIHEYCKRHGNDKVLFVARDGEILQRAYTILFPEEKTEYVYLSRLAAAKLTAGYFKYDYLRKLVYHKAGQGYSLKKILQGMELEVLGGILEDTTKLKAKDSLDWSNVDDFIDFLNDNWQRVLDIYKEQRDAAGIWYRECIEEAQNAVAVDIGWAGSGALALRTLFEKEWHIPCRLTGIVAGTNTVYNAEPDMSETMLLDGSLVSYLYSAADNRDLWKKHNPANMYNIYFELLTSSEHPSFKGFYFDENGKVELKFQKPEGNHEGIRDIQQGILDFVRDYKAHFENYPYMFHISGRDAYAPMLLAAGYRERYLRRINEEFELNIGVN